MDNQGDLEPVSYAEFQRRLDRWNILEDENGNHPSIHHFAQRDTNVFTSVMALNDSSTICVPVIRNVLHTFGIPPQDWIALKLPTSA